jgi:hypothetical protein
MNATQQIEQVVIAPTNTSPPSPSVAQPRVEDSNWLLVGWAADDAPEQKDWPANPPRTDVRISDPSEVAAGADIFVRRFAARVRFPVIYIRPPLRDAFEIAAAAGAKAMNVDTGSYLFLDSGIPFHPLGAGDGVGHGYWDILVTNIWPEPKNLSWMNKYEDVPPAGETLNGDRWAGEVPVPPLAALRVWLSQYANARWSAAKEYAREEHDSRGAADMCVPTVAMMEAWIAQLAIKAAPATAVEVEGTKPARRIVRHIDEASLHAAAVSVFKDFRRRGVTPTGKQKVEAMRKGGKVRGQDAVLRAAFDAVASDPDSIE